MGGVSMMPAICVCTALNGREERGCAGLGRPPGRPAAAAQTTRRTPGGAAPGCPAAMHGAAAPQPRRHAATQPRSRHAATQPHSRHAATRSRRRRTMVGKVAAKASVTMAPLADQVKISIWPGVSATT